MMRFAATACVVYLSVVALSESSVFGGCDPTREPDKSDIAHARATARVAFGSPRSRAS